MPRHSGIRLEWLVKSGAALLFALLLLMTLNSYKLLTKTRGYLEDELEARLMNLKEIISPEVEGWHGRKEVVLGRLRSIAVTEGLDRIRLIDRGGRTVADSLGRAGEASSWSATGIDGESMEEVWSGLTVVSPVYESGSGLVRSAYFPVRDLDGHTAVVCEFTLGAGHIKDLTELGTTHFMLKSVVVVFIIISLLYLMRSLLVSQKRIVQAAGGANVGSGRSAYGDDVDFVVSSFQNIVRELKEKEGELRELKDRAEEKARRIESYNENVLRSVQSGVMTFDIDGTVRTLNPAALKALGLDESEVTGKDIHAVFGEGSWLSGIVDATLRNSLANKRGEGGFVTPDGSRRWLGAGTSPLMDDDGALAGAILVFTDLSEVKQLRDQMELKERTALLGDMSAGIAHELRNPMAVISGYARLLAKKLGGDAESLEAVESMQEEIAGMDDIIREFMNFARPAELNLTDVEIGRVLDDAARAAAANTGSPNIKLEVEDGMPPVYGDQVLLRQAFVNIINNGFESMCGEGVLTIKASLTEPVSGAGPEPYAGREVRIDFADTGAGISEDDLKKIFTPFYTTKGMGTGLGLALVQKILVHHGGRASVASEKGRGTVFSVYLPAGAREVNTDG